MNDKLTLVPVSLRAANAYVLEHHRHHGPARGHKFALGVADGSGLRGVAIAGRPVSRHLDDGMTLEVLRVCTDGVPNACSKLYGAVRRAALAMGYQRVITYTLADESGVSLRAAGWVPDASVKGESWNRPSRSRDDKHPVVPKVRWRAGASPKTPTELAETTGPLDHHPTGDPTA